MRLWLPQESHGFIQRRPGIGRLLRFWRTDPAADVNDEIGFHIDSLVSQHIAAGTSAEAARDAALRRFGDIADITRTLRHLGNQRERAMRLSERLDSIRHDLRFALRQLAKGPVFTLVAVLTMALGIGANSAIFSVVYSVLLRPLPFANGDRLLNLRERNGPEDKTGMFVTVGNYGTWAEQSREFEALGAYYFGGFTLTGAGDPQNVSATRATASYWKALYVPPAIGRYFSADEDRPGAPHVVVLSYGLWKSAFAGDSQVIGRAITLNGEPYTVVGVAGAEYSISPRATAVWVPLALSPAALREHSDHELTVVGLVRPGVSSAQAVNELNRIEAALFRQYPHSYFDGTILASSERDAVVGPSTALLLLLAGAVGLVLLIACVNVANLLLARAASRQKEIAIRSALGAGRARIVAQLLAESLLLAAAGAAAGLGFAAAAIRFLVTGAPAFVPRLHEATLNGPVVAFTAALAMLCGLGFGLVPALRATRVDLQETLRDGVRGSASAIRDRLRAALVVAEVSLALMLLAGAGLFVRSAVLLQRVPPGFVTHDLLVGSVGLPQARYATDALVTAAFQQIVQSASAVPGVESVALVSRIPIGASGSDGSVCPEGTTEGDGKAFEANVRIASPNYFSVLRVPLLRGRTFAASDAPSGPNVVMINAALAHGLFGDANPIGRRIGSCPGMAQESPAWYEVVGVVGDMHANGLERDAANEVYYSSTQRAQRGMWLAVRGATPVAALAPAIRRAVASVDPQLPLSGLSTMDAIVARSMAAQQFTTLLLTLLGATGLLLAAVGIYGVISYFVAQRTHEIGVRVALGASTQDVLALVVGQALVLTLIGVAIGSGVSLFLTRMFGEMLYGITPHDPLTFAAVAALLTAVALVASFIPAWRATRVDPLTALRAS